MEKQPTLPKGTRDFGPAVMAKRQFIFKNIRKVFKKYGFLPLETPAMENLSTLTGKYGDEGDQLLFRILNSGDVSKELSENLELLFLKSNTRIQTLFDAVNTQVGTNKARSVKEIEGFVNESIDDQLEFDYRILFKSFKTQIATKIKQWFDTPLHSKDSKDIYQEFFTIRNGLISELLSEIKSRATTEIPSTNLLKNYVTEKGLRYDLTVPFARYVVMNRNEVSFPFKRYQIQPVWRADRPQKGRYREFYQCDADVVGTDSLICEAEIILMIKEVFKGLGITDYTIKINHRGILSGIAEAVDAKENETALFVAIDKLDKIGEEKVKEELRPKGFSEESLTKLFNILHVKGSTNNKMSMLVNTFDTSEKGQKGLRDLQEVLNLLKSYGETDDHVEFDVSLARGLSYYTGCIFEVKINHVAIGSVSGGGRYDNLTQSFGDKENLSGVGFSFGVDRIFDAMEELNLFPKGTQVSSKVLVCHFDDESKQYGIGVLAKLRQAGIASEVYPDTAKIKKQLDYANKKMIPFTIVIGSEEMQSGQLACKNMEKGEQEKLSIDQIIALFKV